MCVEIQGVKVLTISGSLSCADFVNPVSVCWCLETETSFSYWSHLSRFHLKMEAESSFQNTVILNKRQDDG
jgi:hypothetical protein